MKILLVDNYDSFTFNLFHLIRDVINGEDTVDMVLNDQVNTLDTASYDSIIISPGPGIPKEAGHIMELIRRVAPHIPLLGICLGHQAIAEVFGARLVQMESPVHGISSEITILNESGIFQGLGNKIRAGRYHSWRVDKDGFPDTLDVTAVDGNGNVMAVSHRQYGVFGVQFHPESFMTDHGSTLIRNFLLYSR